MTDTPPLQPTPLQEMVSADIRRAQSHLLPRLAPTGNTDPPPTWPRLVLGRPRLARVTHHLVLTEVAMKPSPPVIANPLPPTGGAG